MVISTRAGGAGTLIRFAPGAATASVLQGGAGGFTYDIRDFAVGQRSHPRRGNQWAHSPLQ